MTDLDNPTGAAQVVDELERRIARSTSFVAALREPVASSPAAPDLEESVPGAPEPPD